MWAPRTGGVLGTKDLLQRDGSPRRVLSRGGIGPNLGSLCLLREQTVGARVEIGSPEQLP